MASTPQTLWDLPLKIFGSLAAIGFLILLVRLNGGSWNDACSTELIVGLN
jgi:hypothetical protein